MVYIVLKIKNNKKQKKMLKKEKVYDIVIYVKTRKHTERCPSGLRSWS